MLMSDVGVKLQVFYSAAFDTLGRRGALTPERKCNVRPHVDFG